MVLLESIFGLIQLVVLKPAVFIVAHVPKILVLCHQLLYMRTTTVSLAVVYQTLCGMVKVVIIKTVAVQNPTCHGFIVKCH